MAADLLLVNSMFCGINLGVPAFNQVQRGTAVRVIDDVLETRYCQGSKPLEELVRQYSPNSHYEESGHPFEVPNGS
ncbi:hypothetical protein MauCBS54593_005858 [Microsporum audouinii]